MEDPASNRHDDREEIVPAAEFAAQCCFLAVLFSAIVMAGVIYGIYKLIMYLI